MEKRIKKFLIIIMCMAVWITAMPVIEVRAEEQNEMQEASVSIGEITVSNGFYGSLYIYANNFSSVAGIEFSMHYDENLMTDISCWNGWLAEGSTLDVNTNTDGEIKCSLMNIDGMNGSGEMLGFSFRVPENVPEGTYPVTLTIGDAYGTDMNALQIGKESGKIHVTKNTYAESQIYFYTGVSAEEVRAGDEFTYKLYGSSSSGLSGGNFIFEYDRERLELLEVSLGSELEKNTAISSINSDTAGYVKISYADIEAITDYYGIEYFALKFKAKTNVEGDAQIQFSANSLTSVDLNALKTSNLQNTVKIIDPEKAPERATIKLVYDQENSTKTMAKIQVLVDSKKGVAAGDFTVTYDSWMMQCVDCSVSDAVSNASGAYIVTKEDMSGGTVRFSYVNSKPFKEEQVLLTLTFKINDWWSGETTFSVNGKGIVDEEFDKMEVIYESLTQYFDTIPLYIYNYNFWLESAYLVYDGTEKKPKVLNDAGLVEGTDYTVDYWNNIGVGTATVDVWGINNYEGHKSLEFMIISNNINDYSFWIEPSVMQYDGTEKRPQVLNDGGLVENIDYTLKYQNNTNKGIGNVIITGTGKYTGQIIQIFEIVAEGEWIKDSKGYWYRRYDGSYPRSEWKTIEGNLYYFDGSGYRAEGWKFIDNQWYYFNTDGLLERNRWVGNYYINEHGIRVTNAWVDNGKYYVNETGAYISKTGWFQLDGEYYYLKSGKKQTGWLQSGSTWYYLDLQTGKMLSDEWLQDTYYFKPNGAMATGWVSIDGNYYYFNGGGAKVANMWVGNYYLKADGIMATNEWVDSERYYVNASGVRTTSTGWFKLAGEYYYLKAGKKQTGWLQVGTYWYYLNKETGIMVSDEWLDDIYYFKSNGAMATGWVSIDGNYYYFNSSGAKVTNKWAGNYYLKADGIMATNEWVDSNKYYVNSSGVYVSKTGWFQLDGEYYYLKSGKKQTGWLQSGSKWYYLDPVTGIMLSNEWLDDTYYLGPSGAMVTGHYTIDGVEYNFDSSGKKVS